MSNSSIKKIINNNSNKKKLMDLENFIQNIKDEYLTKDFSQTEFDNEISFNIDEIKNNNNNIITDYSKNITINNTDFNNNTEHNKKNIENNNNKSSNKIKLDNNNNNNNIFSMETIMDTINESMNNSNKRKFIY